MIAFIYTLLKDAAKAIRQRQQSLYSQEEREILAASDMRGDICLLRVDAFGDWVRSGKTDFFKQNDLAYNARYQDALDALLHRGLIRYEGGHLFRLTGRGFNEASRIKSLSQHNREEPPTGQEEVSST